ncbi:single-stranded DNA-binding protein [Treponema sp. HNW]|uniref:single-stranded DNA-binding protein n=1 Tax=Treponema sp. HNW TaxID=3116654 RepID=UPI003D1263AA
MNSLNSIILEGNIVQEPVLRETAKGTSVCTFSIMCTRTYKQDEGYEKEISFFNIDAWGKLAELTVKNGTKGRGVRVVGRLKQSRWVDSEEKNRSKISIVAEHIEFKPVFKNAQTKGAVKIAEAVEDTSVQEEAVQTEEYDEVPVF